ncbi:hypothetical protein GCM10007898_13670 [Dyella flagellata]|uniref:eCIS core domain-containing protein n=2 Tax=Dyella flagellata TaxID=1867833 RepID=A0ABQ5XAV8_9GAMM|nr:hypothetical protein GCM10007898_13670 [Dyella flagellata]
MDMGDVVVHRNSTKPAQLNALAYAQGNDIHLGSGQEQHLPHEAWHVVQQRKGLVKATAQLAGVAVNDNPGLEREADVMGARALSLPAQLREAGRSPSEANGNDVTVSANADKPMQMMLPYDGLAETKGYYKAQNRAKAHDYGGGRPVDFSTNFKMSMVKNEWGGSYNKAMDLWHVTTSGKSQVVLPTNAIQIDHKTPWAEIEQRLLVDPSEQGGISTSKLKDLEDAGYINEDQDAYTVYAARMYYHDVPNLQPMAGSENASKGAGVEEGVSALAVAWKNRASRSTGTHNEMVQSAFQALRDWSTDNEAITEMLQEFDKVDEATAEAEDFFKGY